MTSFDIKAVLLAVTCFMAGTIFKSIIGVSNEKLPTTETIDAKLLTIKRCDNQTNIRESERPYVSKSSASFSTTLPVMKEIIPTTLHQRYAPENIEFNISRSMLKRSRPIIGNTERLHAYIRKLQSKQCTVVLFLGGSVTDGHHVKGGSSEAYPVHFLIWLNARYPCVDVDGKPGYHEMKKTHAQNSQTHFVFWSMVSDIERIDLVLIEFNVRCICLAIATGLYHGELYLQHHCE
jgi:hypothetical protein